MNEITINIDEIFDFIHKSIYQIVEQTNCEENEIIACIPNYILDFIIRQYPVSNNAQKKPSGDIFIFGIKCQINHENSVVVFYNGYTPELIIKYTKEL